MKDIFLQGDWVEYSIKNEIGLVRQVNDANKTLYVWLHTGGTASRIHMDMVKQVNQPNLFKTYRNGYALPSLEERRVRMLSGKGDYTDLIENADVRAVIKRKYGLT